MKNIHEKEEKTNGNEEGKRTLYIPASVTLESTSLHMSIECVHRLPVRYMRPLV